jgi:polar amino acid transport system substrate-binding protein
MISSALLPDAHASGWSAASRGEARGYHLAVPSTDKGADMRRVSIFAAVAALLAITAAQAAELPEQIKQAGTVRLTVSSTYAPMEYRDPATNELIGLDIDLASEIAKRLSLKIVWSETAFAEIVPALQTKRADFVISGISDRLSRRETADFVDYLKTGPQFFVLAPNATQAAVDLCGKKVGTTRSSIFPVEIEKWSKANCEAAGKPAVQFVPGENAIDVRSQLKQGRIDAAVQGSETLPYALKQEPGKYRIVGEPFSSGYQGIMFRKDEPALRQVVMDVLATMIADGAYQTILAKWDLAANAVTEPMLNAAAQ